MVGEYEDDQEIFRNKPNSIKEEGGRNWVYPKKPTGKFTNAREIVAFFLLAFFFTAPFIKINGHPLLQLNILERKFIIFGTAFWPSDFHLLAIGGLTLLLTVVIFTAVFGRIWCGWACPQTIFMEMVFRKIEYWIEGDRSAQIRLDKQDWDREKILKKGGKHIIFFTLSFVVANLFLSYIIGVEELGKIITDPPSHHWVGLTAITIFSFVFYSVFARFREQVCHFACPYGRYQSVMVNEDSVCVSYDFKRGENRANQKERVKAEKTASAKVSANTEVSVLDLAQGGSVPESKPFGDCIDCGECVRVCPMGIDIRNGIQLECVHCTACIDACDAVMEKIGKPKQLIKYASYNNIKKGINEIFTTRVKAYSVVLTVLASLFVYMLTTRADVESIVTRVPGVLFARIDDQTSSNLFNYKLVNKTFEKKHIELKILSPSAADLRNFGEFPNVNPQDISEGRFMVILPNSNLEAGKAELVLGLFVDGKQVEEIKTRFTGPK
ncbi:cytochrome c oxidase accessory protein CcoG [bacterium]|nr:MAG: cytochrome c oxidase accessory protein CcoG [bacterium]